MCGLHIFLPFLENEEQAYLMRKKSSLCEFLRQGRTILILYISAQRTKDYFTERPRTLQKRKSKSVAV